MENERLIESVSKVTDLLRSNQYLRDELDKLQKGTDVKDNELFTITQENLSLRERIEVLEGIIKSNKQDYENLVSAKVLNTMEKSTFEYTGGAQKYNTIDQVYQELIELRENNRILEKRVKTLEKQNIDITKNLNYVGNNEPARPVFKQRKVNQRAGYQEDSEIDDFDGHPQMHGNGRGESMGRQLHKVQSTPMMMKNPYPSQHHLGHMNSETIAQQQWEMEQQRAMLENQFRITQMSKNSSNSQGGVGLSQGLSSGQKWFQIKKSQSKNPG